MALLSPAQMAWLAAKLTKIGRATGLAKKEYINVGRGMRRPAVFTRDYRRGGTIRVAKGARTDIYYTRSMERPLLRSARRNPGATASLGIGVAGGAALGIRERNKKRWSRDLRSGMQVGHPSAILKRY